MTINAHAKFLDTVRVVQADRPMISRLKHYCKRSLPTWNPTKGPLNLKLHLFSESSISVSPSRSSGSLASGASTSISDGLATVTLDLSYSVFSNTPGGAIDPTATDDPRQPLQSTNSSETCEFGVKSRFTIS